MPSRPTATKAPPTGRRILPALLALVVSVLLAQAAYFGLSVLHRPPGADPVRLELQGADSFYSLEQQRTFVLVYRPAISFTLRGPPGAALPLRNYRVVDNRAVPLWSQPLTVTLDAEGAFTGTARPLHGGINLLAAWDRWGDYSGDYAWFLPRSDPYDLAGITRTLEISLTLEQVFVTYRATFLPGATDADLSDLLAGHIEPVLFIKRVFYSTAGDFTCKLFADVSTPQVTIKNNISRVEIRAKARDAQLKPGQLAALLNVSPPQESWTQLPTTVTVTAGEGVAVRSYSPIPTIVEGRACSWVNSDVPISLDYDAGGELDPISEPIVSVRRELQRVSHPLWRSLWQPITFLLLLTLLFFPFVWLRRSAVLESEAGLLPPLESGIGFIIAMLVAFVGGVGLLTVVAVLTGGSTGLSVSGAVWAAAVGCVAVLALHRYPRVRLRWLWLVLSPLLAAAALGLPGRSMWRFTLSIALAGVPLLLFVYWLGRELARPGAFLDDDLGSWSGRARLLGLLLLLVVLASPVAQDPDFYSPLGGWWPATGLSLTLLTLLVLVPLAALPAALGLLRRQGGARVGQEDVRRAEQAGAWAAAREEIKEGLGEALTEKTRDVWALDSSLLAIGQLLLAYFALGVLRRPLASDLTALIPIAPVLGWLLFRRLIRQPEETGLSYTERVVLASKRLRVSIGREVLGKSSHQRDKEEADQGQSLPSLKLPQYPEREVPLRDVLFGWGRADQPWENAKAACTWGAVLVAILLILYGPAILKQALERAATPFVLLETLTVYFIPFAARWLLYAFILGYFFPYIRGRHGWQKGLYLALTISACTLTQDVVMQAHSVNDVLGLLFEAGQVIVYLSVIGIWAFDLPRIKEAGGSMADLLRVYGLPFLTSYLSGLLPALAGIVQSVITGEFSSIVQTFVEIVLPTLHQLGGVP
ncbi:MAG: hypothetical protein DRI80_07545 [Chloroflexota bacterium]|nr:MAG: hypothetical protein DRI80_07545 [Chloroflexota bacterium]